MQDIAGDDVQDVQEMTMRDWCTISQCEFFRIGHFFDRSVFVLIGTGKESNL